MALPANSCKLRWPVALQQGTEQRPGVAAAAVVGVRCQVGNVQPPSWPHPAHSPGHRARSLVCHQCCGYVLGNLVLFRQERWKMKGF